MIKKYIIWSFFAITIGIFSSFWLTKITTISASHIKDIIYLTPEEAPIETTEEQEEIIPSENIPLIDNKFEYKENTKISELNFLNRKIGEPWGIVSGLTMFRGNPSRTWYGTGPMPANPETKWKYPNEKMCSTSTSLGKTSIWCGSGWTGQPVVFENEKENGKVEVIFGAYDGQVHFVDGTTGQATKTPFQTDDIIKGSVTLDPDGFPLLYFGSRDNKLRILSIEDTTPKELWALDAKNLGGVWNNDWDGNPVIIDDILYEGGENGWFYAIKLNRKINENNKVEVYPNIIFSMPSYNKELIDLVGRNVSIENSLSFFNDRVYFSNSGGRVLGLDISNIENGIAPIIFDYWVGDDVDSTIVIDDDGMLYVSVEEERFNTRSDELGQFIKLDPYKIDNPYIWGIKIPKEDFTVGGIWATPALYKDYLYIPTHTGKFLGVNKESGEIVWEEKISPHSWSSPIITDDDLLIGTCDGHLKKYSLNNPELPTLEWSYLLGNGSCIESTPAIWNGQIFVGSRDGYFYKIDEKL
jgi:outer membrane protein assembly factor BamB